MGLLVQGQQATSSDTWHDIKSSGITGSVEYKKYGDVVAVNISVDAGLTIGSYIEVGLLPADATPPSKCSFVGLNGVAQTVLIDIASGGTNKVRVYLPSGTSSTQKNCYTEVLFML